MRAMRVMLVLGCVVAWAPLAAAQTVEFPPEEDWTPLRCDDDVMTDGLADEPDALDERDLVGDDDAPAGLHAADEDFLYLRMRLDVDPTDGDGVTLSPFSWGMAFDLDGDLTTYDLLVLANGITAEISLFENTEVTVANDPTDPADEPAAFIYAFEDTGRSLALPAGFGGDADAFLDVAIPWEDLAPLGLEPDTPISVWVASSTSDDSLDGDFACHDGGSGAPDLEGTASDETTADPDADGGDGAGDDGAGDDGAGDDGGGDDGDGAEGEPRLEGGGGCTAMRGDAGLGLALLALLVIAGLGGPAWRRRGG
jgi:hypothetical protein